MDIIKWIMPKNGSTQQLTSTYFFKQLLIWRLKKAALNNLNTIII